MACLEWRTCYRVCCSDGGILSVSKTYILLLRRANLDGVGMPAVIKSGTCGITRPLQFAIIHS
jgi:hypothetical protein